MKDVYFDELARFQPKQKEADRILFTPECKYLLYGGAAGGGKSYFLRWEALKLALYYASKYHVKHIPIGLFSEDYPTLRDRQMVKIETEFPKWLGELKESKQFGLGFHLRSAYGGGVIMLRNLDDPSKYASVEFAAILVEELTKNPKDTFDDLRFRLRYPGVLDPKFVGATNPGGIGHGYVRKLWVSPDPSDPDVEQERFFFVQAFYSDNKHIAPGYDKQLDALPPDKRMAFKEGSWDVFAGQYFIEFNRHIHTWRAFTPRADLMKVGGLDWGRSKPFSFLAGFVQEVEMLTDTQEVLRFNRLWIYSEAYGTDRSPAEWAEVIKGQVRLSEFREVRADPSVFTKNNDNSISIADQFGKNGVKLRPASNDRIGGWESVHHWLSIAPDGYPYLIIMDNCTNLIRTLPELIHDKTKVEDVDSDGEDHAADALRYMVKHVKWIGDFGGVYRPEGRKLHGRESFVVTNGTIPAPSIKELVGKPQRDWRYT